MHRLIEDHLEDVLAGTLPAGHPAMTHLRACDECRDESGAMQAQSNLFQAFRFAETDEPRAGFYARVLECIETQRPVSIWALFTDSVLGRRLATASLALAMATGAVLFSMERIEPAMVAAVELDPLYPSTGGFANEVMAENAADNGAVFLSLASYRSH
jgi:hypothetical protein